MHSDESMPGGGIVPADTRVELTPFGAEQMVGEPPLWLGVQVYILDLFTVLFGPFYTVRFVMFQESF